MKPPPATRSPVSGPISIPCRRRLDQSLCEVISDEAAGRTARPAVFIQNSPKREDQRTAGRQFRKGPMGACRARLGGNLERSAVGRLDEQAPDYYFAAALAGGLGGSEAEG